MKRKVVVIGGGAAGLVAAWTLKKAGIDVLLLEADSRLGGRLGGDRVDGFCIDQGADFFCSSYDTTFQICEELGLPLIRSKMNLGWCTNGRWVVTTPIDSVRTLINNLNPFLTLGLLSPGVIVPLMRLKKGANHLNFSSECRMAEVDTDENLGEYLTRIGMPEKVKVFIRGILEMTMGHIDVASAAYMRTYMYEMLFNADKLYAPEQGAGALTHALVKACGDIISVSSPVKRVIVRNGVACGVAVDEGLIEADAVICATTASKVPELVPDLPPGIRGVLGRVVYSNGCRVVIGLDHPPLPPGWHGALYPEDETPLLLDRSINLPAIAPPGKSTLDLLVGRDRAQELIPLDDEEIARQMLRDARRNPPPGSRLPGDGEGLFTRVYRWKEAVCMMSPGIFKEIVDMRRQLGRSVKNLVLAGDYMRIPSVNGALTSGVDAAAEVASLLKSRTGGTAQ